MTIPDADNVNMRQQLATTATRARAWNVNRLAGFLPYRLNQKAGACPRVADRSRHNFLGKMAKNFPR
jgi:hypothetical protein